MLLFWLYCCVVFFCLFFFNVLGSHFCIVSVFICARRASSPAMSKPRRTMRRNSTGSGCGVAALLYPLLGACLWASVLGYKPVVIIHGLFDSSGDFKNLLRFINQVSDCSGSDWIFYFLCLCLVICINNRSYYRCFFYWPGCKQSGPLSLCNHVSPQQQSVEIGCKNSLLKGTRINGSACYYVFWFVAAMSFIIWGQV